MKTILLAPLLIGLAACGTSVARPEVEATETTAAVLTLDDQESQLVTSFNAHSEHAQLLVILSPT